MKVLLTLILLYILASGCANIQSPPGGSGDTIAPYIEYTKPINETINFDDDEVIIGFDDYMNRGKVIENLRITPEVKMEFDWSASDLTIQFAESLEKNTTYAINIGTEFTDYYNNSPKTAFSLIFSTGNVLDSGTISGVLSAPDTKGKYVFLYKKRDGAFPDIGTSEPDYFVNIGSSGEFQFVALKPGEYRLLAIDDKFQNRLYDDQIDAFGTALTDVTLTSDSLKVNGIDIYLGQRTDKIGPQLLSATSKYSGLTNILFDENLDISEIKKENFELSYEAEKVEIESIGSNNTNSSEFILTFDNKYAGKLLELNVKNVADSTGNSIRDTSSNTNFVVDTTYNNDTFSILNTNLNDSTQKNISPNFNIFNKKTPFRVKFSKIPDIKSLKERAYLKYGEKQIPVELVSNNLLDYYFVSDSTLKENSDYVLIFDTKNIEDLWGNKLVTDTVYNTKFKTAFAPKFSQISGKVELETDCSGDVTITAKNKADNTEYKTSAVDGNWKIEKVTAGTYIFEIYCDANNDGKYTFGSVVPFEYREKYSASKEYTIDENWEYNDIKLKLDE